VTGDGIATEDWDRIHELALDVVNLSTGGDQAGSDSAALRLRELLDDLQEKYGPLPSLLATRADYAERVEDREYWLVAAYEQAETRHDERNLVWIAASLATLFVDDRRDRGKGAEWLARLELHLQVFPDSSEAEEADRLRRILKRLGAGSRRTSG
jgi:hypothetical protein